MYGPNKGFGGPQKTGSSLPEMAPKNSDLKTLRVGPGGPSQVAWAPRPWDCRCETSGCRARIAPRTPRRLGAWASGRMEQPARAQAPPSPQLGVKDAKTSRKWRVGSSEIVNPHQDWKGKPTGTRPFRCPEMGPFGAEREAMSLSSMMIPKA